MSTTPAPAPQPALSETSRLINTFISPSRTFTDIRLNSSWWIPWLLISVISLVFMFTIQQKIGLEQVAHNEIAKSSRFEPFEKLPPEQKDAQVRLSMNMMRYMGYAAPITTLIFLAIIAGVLMGTMNFGAGAEISFKQSMAVVAYSFVPGLIGSVLGIVSMLVGVDAEGFNIRNPVATNPAYFMDPTQHKFLYGMVSALDVFIIWAIILMGIGYSSISKLKRSTAIAIVVGWYLVYKLAASALGTLG